MPILDFPDSTGLPVGATYAGAETTWRWDGEKWTTRSFITLDDIHDIIITDAAQDDVLVYDGANWQNEPDVNGRSF